MQLPSEMTRTETETGIIKMDVISGDVLERRNTETR